MGAVDTSGEVGVGLWVVVVVPDDGQRQERGGELIGFHQCLFQRQTMGMGILCSVHSIVEYRLFYDSCSFSEHKSIFKLSLEMVNTEANT